MADISLDDRLLDALEGVAYVVDCDGAIVALGEHNWRSFAASGNAADILAPGAVIGRNIYEFITGDDVRAYYRERLRRLSFEQGTGMATRIRCDAPSVKRELRLSVMPIWIESSVRGFLFQSIVMNETVRPPIDLFDFQARARTTMDDMRPIVRMCSICQRLESPSANGVWVEAAEYYQRGGEADVRLSHGICQTCSDRDVFVTGGVIPQ